MSNENIKKVKSSDIELKDKLVSIQRVTKVTKGGRNFTFSAIVVVGNEKGIVGYGLGKAKEVTDAITKGIEDAKKNLDNQRKLRLNIISNINHQIYLKYRIDNAIIRISASDDKRQSLYTLKNEVLPILKQEFS